MQQRELDFLKTLVETPSPSGFEQMAAQVWRAYVAGVSDAVTTDYHGNVVACVNPGGSPRVMLSGHIDEIGFLVRHIDEHGYLYFGTIGGFDPLTLPGERVRLLGKNGPLLGVIGRAARHLQRPGDQSKGVEIDDLWIDIGASNKEHALTLVEAGTAGTRAQGFEPFNGEQLVVSRALDNKCGAYVVARALELIRAGNPTAAVYAVASVQEEVGLRGARTSAFHIDPAVAIAVDVTHAADYPTADKRRSGDIRLGNGPTITFGPTTNPRITSLLWETAQTAGISVQREAEPRNTGTDADAIQVSRGGVATGLVGIPLRYMHTGAEIGSLSDIEHAAEVIAATVLRLGPDTVLVP
jgi:endoglucanase